MNKSALKNFSLLSIRVALLGFMVILGMTAIFPGWYDKKHIIWEEFTANFMSKDDLQIREEAKRQQVPFNEYKAKVLQKRANIKERELLAVNLKEAIDAKNDQSLTTLLMNAKKQHFPEDLYVQAIKNNYVNGFEIIHVNGIACTATHEQFKGDSILFNKIGSIRYKTLDAILTSHSSMFNKWAELGCYESYEHIEQRLVNHERLPELLAGVSFADKGNKLWEKLLWRSIKSNKANVAEQLLNNGVLMSEDYIVSINKGRSQDRRKMDMFSLIFQQGRYQLAELLLKNHPSYITENNLDQAVFDALKQGPQSKDIYEVFSSNLIQLDALSISTSNELEQAITKGHLPRIIWLLELDPTLNFSVLNNSTVDYSMLDRRMNGFVSAEQITMLMGRGLDLNLFKYNGLDQLSGAIKNGDIDVISSLLGTDIQLDRLFRGKSILNVKTYKNTHNKEEIRRLLIENGAHDDLGLLVRQETGVEFDPQCKIGKRNIADYGNNSEYLSLINSMFDEHEDPLTADHAELCHFSLLACTKNQNNSLDDCFESAPSCSGDNIDSVYSKESPVNHLCCPEKAKLRYNEMRCSGLGVISASFSLADMGFPTAYSIPGFMINTREYQEQSLKQQKEDELNFKKSLESNQDGRGNGRGN